MYHYESPSVTFEHDYSDSTGWTEVGSTSNISSGVWTSNGAGNNADHGFYKALGFTLDDEKWYVEFDIKQEAGGTVVESGVPLYFSAGTAKPLDTSHDALGIAADNGGGVNAWKNTAGTALGPTQSTALTQGTQYYGVLIRTSDVNLQLKYYTDSARTSQHGSTVDITIDAGITGLNTIQHRATDNGGTSSGTSNIIDNVKVYNGVISPDPSTPANTKLLGLNDVTFSIGTDTASVDETVTVTTTLPAQGNDGGHGQQGDPYPHGGGGGAGQVGGNNSNASTGGDGGDGLQSDITGTNTYYAGGGAGNTVRNWGNMGTAGLGSGGSTSWGGQGGDGLGGGGNGEWDVNVGGDGGDGVVILQIPSGTSYSTTGSPTIDTSSVSGKIVLKYTSLSSSSLTINSAVDVRYLVVAGGGGATGPGGGGGGIST